MVVLASGMATRLLPLIKRGEKHLICVGGKPLLVRTYHTLKHVLNSSELHLVSVVRKGNEDLYRKALQDYIDEDKIHIVSNEQAENTNNSFTLLLGLKYVIDSFNNHDVIVMNGDIVLLHKLNDSRHSETSIPNDISLIVSFEADKAHFMRAFVDNDKIVWIGFDIPSHIANAVVLGLYIPSDNILKFLNTYERYVNLTNKLPWFEYILDLMIINEELELKAWPLGDEVIWWEIDDPNDYIYTKILDDSWRNILRVHK